MRMKYRGGVRQSVQTFCTGLWRASGGFARGTVLVSVLAVGVLTVGQAAASSGDIPEAPQNITGVALHHAMVHLDWDDVIGADSYEIELFDGQHGWQRLPSPEDGIMAVFTDSSVILDGLDVERYMQVQIRAVNSAGASAWSEIYSMPGTSTFSFSGLPRPRLVGAPSVPTGVVASAELPSRIDITWAAPTDVGTSDVTDYRVEFSLNPDSDYSWHLLGHTGGPTTMMSHTELQSRRSYTYRVSAINDSGRGPHSVVATGSTQAPSDQRRICSDAPEHEVALSSGLVPSGHGLEAGDRFRLLFVTSEHRNAVPTDIGAYNRFVGDVASRGMTAIQPYASDFRVVGSTRAVSARSNTCTQWTEESLGYPIYWLGNAGARAADDYRDFYDGNWDNARKINERGESSGFDFGTYKIATGSTHAGSPKRLSIPFDPDDPVDVEELGHLSHPCPWLTLGEKLDQAPQDPYCQAIETGASTSNTEPDCAWNTNWGVYTWFCQQWGPLEDVQGYHDGFGFQTTFSHQGKHVRDNEFYYYAMSPVFRIEGGCDSLWCGTGTVLPVSDNSHHTSFTLSEPFTYGGVDYEVTGFSADVSANEVSLTVSPSPAANAFDFLTLNSDELRLLLKDAGQSDGTFTWNAASWIGTDGGLFSDNADFTVTLDVDLVPDAPTELSAQGRGREVIDLQWAAPADPGGGAITGYRIELSLNGGYDWNVLVPNTGTADTTWTHSGLSAGARHYYAVSAINGGGFGPRSETAFGATTPARVPDRPINVELTKADDEPHILVWDAPADDGGTDVTDYVVERSWDGESWERLPNIRSDELLLFSTTYLDDVQLDRSLRYYRVSAVNRVGTGPASVILQDGTAVITPPDKPSELSMQRSGDLMTLNWNPPADDGGSAITGYKFESSRNCVEWDLSEFETTATSYSEEAPSEAVVYCFRVAAVNAAGSSSQYALATSAASAPDAPESLSASATQTEITLSWEAPADDGGAKITGYHIDWSPDGVDWALLEQQTVYTENRLTHLGRVSSEHSSLIPDTEYHYRVAAQNSAGTSAWVRLTHSTEPDVHDAATWSALLTVGATQYGEDAFMGYSVFNPDTNTPLGSLSSTDFFVDKNGHTIAVLAVVGDTLWPTLGHNVTPESFTLAIEDQQFSSADATVPRQSTYSRVYQWPGTTLDWFETDIVKVSLTIDSPAEETGPAGLPESAE
ncbi:fibronectin type III domain-containing protein [Candidatus Poriferisodalis sp.]|uniref:fibronectin type III domain-containing protein n=1 Tax=Candidatus Poriferisodalis sp. TaxID=3101277 RepID=UPI003B5AF30E